jgi:bla regulator protein blaR1
MRAEFIVNHLWQSTCFAIVASVLAFMLRGNSPKVRYWVWLSASLKFIVPWALLVSLGSLVPRQAHRVVSTIPALPDTLVQIAKPFSANSYAGVPSPAPIHWNVTALALLWAAGFIAIAFKRCRSWYGIRAMLGTGAPVELPIAVPTVIAPGAHEPGLVGILRPVLVLPTLLLEHLNAKQLEALLAHELSHIRRRDNFFAALHMGVEAIFWFHPFVWWIGSRMLEERELACDEEVLRLGCEPADYARGILTVCEHYSEMPLPCVSGVTGADVKKRVKTILRGTLPRELSGQRKVVLALAAVAAIVLPIGLGVWSAPAAHAQSTKLQEEPERFEVISIKVHPEPIEFRDDDVRGETFHFVGLPLINLIMDAYKMGGLQISGGPGWVRSGAYFDVEAKASGSAPLTGERLRSMLQAMLADRFQLKVQRGTREMPCYDLVVAKGGVKMKENTDPGPPGGVANGTDANGVHVRAESGTMVRLARNLLADRLVVDKTGLSGKYHIALDYATINTPDADVPTLNTAIEEQLGLKLEPSRTTLETLVIQSVEKPSGN